MSGPISEPWDAVQPLYPGRLQWWVIYGEDLWAALTEAQNGGNAVSIYQRLYDESDHDLPAMPDYPGDDE